MVTLHGIDRASGREVEEPVVALDPRAVPRAYAAQGWLGLGRPDRPGDVVMRLVELSYVADSLRDRLLGQPRR